MKVGDTVVYVKDPALYGEMEVVHKLKGGRWRCIIDPDGRRPDLEVFAGDELEVGTVTQAGLPTPRAA